MSSTLTILPTNVSHIQKSHSSDMKCRYAEHKTNIRLGDCNNDLPKKIALVLDMDECLIHSRFGVSSNEVQKRKEWSDSIRVLAGHFELCMEDGERVVVNKRPGLDEFLLRCSKEFDVYAYTAASKVYGHPLLDELDPHNTIFKGRFYRDSCIGVAGYFLKDLTVIRSDLSRVILVDNNPASFVLQPNNGIPVPSFYDNTQDTALCAVYKILQRMKQYDDVRPQLQQMFQLAHVLERNPYLF